MDTLLIIGGKYLFLLSAGLFLVLFWKLPSESRKQMLIISALSFPLALIISMIARELHFNPRPFVVGGFEPLIAHKPDNGFPSDHALLVFALASVATLFHKKIGLALWIIAITVALSRVFAGVHHLLDVVASMVIASACVILIINIYEYTRKYRNK
jgi:undecaprenyl-diphosphatase